MKAYIMIGLIMIVFGGVVLVYQQPLSWYEVHVEAAVGSLHDSDYQYHTIIEQEHPFKAQGILEVIGLDGTVMIEAWAQKKVQVQATVWGKRPEVLHTIEPEIALYNEYAKIESKVRGLVNHEVKIDYLINVPAEVKTMVETKAGMITINNVKGPIVAHSSAGMITIIRAANSINAQVESGAITVVQQQFPADAQINLQVGAGSLSLSLPANVNAQLEAITNVGTIANAFTVTDLTEKQSLVGAQQQGTIGRAGGSITMLANTGMITIKKH